MDQATLSPRLAALLSGTSERSVKVGPAQQGGRTDTLESRTRTGWPTVKAHGMIIDKDRPVRLTALLRLLSHGDSQTAECM